jgi:hypothetical protein
MDQQPKSPFHPDSIRRDIGFIALMLRLLAASVEVFLRHEGTFGERYLGGRALFAGLLIFFFPVFWPDEDPRPMLVYFGLYLAACACIRVATVRRIKRGGPQPHSLYSGEPRLMRITGRISEVTIKGIVEPMLAFVVGALCLPVSEPLGVYLILTALGLLASVQLALGEERQRAIDMNDAYLDQRDAAERFREMQGKQ